MRHYAAEAHIHALQQRDVRVAMAASKRQMKCGANMVMEQKHDSISERERGIERKTGCDDDNVTKNKVAVWVQS